MGEYKSLDITFCSNRRCQNKTCERNQCHVILSIKPHYSVSDFENTEYCPKKRSKQNA